MTRLRQNQFDLTQPRFYHLTSRCVRRAWLCGLCPTTGRSLDHRRTWIEQRILDLGRVFAVEIYAFAVMSNHHHLVIRYDPTAASRWSSRQVVQRATPILRPRSLSDAEYSALLLNDKARLERTRQRIGSISDFMSILNQPIALAANREDGCKGRFWESRAKSSVLLDDNAVLAAMVYADLNAASVDHIFTANNAPYTSLALRNLRRDRERHQGNRMLGPVASGLSEMGELGGMSEAHYRTLVRWTADNQGHTAPARPTALESCAGFCPALKTIADNPVTWLERVESTFEKHHPAGGAGAEMERYSDDSGPHWTQDTPNTAAVRPPAINSIGPSSQAAYYLLAGG